MTQEEQQKELDRYAKEHLRNFIEFGAAVVDDDE